MFSLTLLVGVTCLCGLTALLIFAFISQLFDRSPRNFDGSPKDFEKEFPTLQKYIKGNLPVITYKECCVENCNRTSQKMIAYKYFWGRYMFIEQYEEAQGYGDSTEGYDITGYHIYDRYRYEAHGVIYANVCHECMKTVIKRELSMLKKGLQEKHSPLEELLDLFRGLTGVFSFEEPWFVIILLFYLPIYLIMMLFILLASPVILTYFYLSSILGSDRQKAELRKNIKSLEKAFSNPDLILQIPYIYQKGINFTNRFLRSQGSNNMLYLKSKTSDLSSNHEYEKYEDDRLVRTLDKFRR